MVWFSVSILMLIVGLGTAEATVAIFGIFWCLCLVYG